MATRMKEIESMITRWAKENNVQSYSVAASLMMEDLESRNELRDDDSTIVGIDAADRNSWQMYFTLEPNVHKGQSVLRSYETLKDVIEKAGYKCTPYFKENSIDVHISDDGKLLPIGYAEIRKTNQKIRFRFLSMYQEHAEKIISGYNKR